MYFWSIIRFCKQTAFSQPIKHSCWRREKERSSQKNVFSIRLYTSCPQNTPIFHIGFVIFLMGNKISSLVFCSTPLSDSMTWSFIIPRLSREVFAPFSNLLKGTKVKAFYERQEGNAQPERIQRVIIFQHRISLVLNKHTLGGGVCWGPFIKWWTINKNIQDSLSI